MEISTLHNKEISFSELAKNITSVNKLSQETGNLLQRQEFWGKINTEILEVLQESQHRHEARISRRKSKIEDDLSVYDQLIDECGMNEEDQLLQDIDKKLSELAKVESRTISSKELKQRIFDVIERQTQKEISETITLPRLLLRDIKEIANLSVDEKSIDYQTKSGIKMSRILSVCNISENEIGSEGFNWIIVCRKIAKKLSSKKTYESFLRDTKYVNHSPISDPSHNSFAYGTR